MNTKTATPEANQVQQPGKKEISAKDFSILKTSYMRGRLEQFAERKNVTFGQAQEISDQPQGYAKIDKEVDEEYHSSNCPDPTDFKIV